MSLLKNTLLVCLMGLISVATAQAQIQPGKAHVRVLSYNVKGLPGIIHKYKKTRFPIIGNMLYERLKAGNAPDVVLIQEAFVDSSYDIYRWSGYRNLAQGPGAKGKDANGGPYQKIFNSGLYAMTMHPIVEQSSQAFGTNVCKSWDCYANKGAQMLKVRIPGIPFDLTFMNTHMQASGKYDRQRMQQIDRMLPYMERMNLVNDPYSAFIFGGDFNTNPNHTSFAYFKSMTGMASVGEDCTIHAVYTGCQIEPGTDYDLVLDTSKDHIFYASGVRVSIRAVSTTRNFSEFHRGRQLSDHLGYETLFEVSWQ